MPIQCDQINQTINYLSTAFQDCKQIKAEDMQLLIELIAAVNTCANGGASYNTINNDIYEPEEDQMVTYDIDSFHSISIVVVQGQIIFQGFNFYAGATFNTEFTTTNQQSLTFTVKAGSKVLVEYITETI